MNDPQILLTIEDIRRWRLEVSSTEAEIEELKAKIEELKGRLEEPRLKLNAASVFTNTAEAPKTKEPVSGDEAMPTMIRNIVAHSSTPLLKRQIRDHLENKGLREKLGANYAYFYTVMSRLIEKNRLVEKDGRYSLPE